MIGLEAQPPRPKRCNCERYDGVKKRLVPCGLTAVAKHPRWPRGRFCEAHQTLWQGIFPKGWAPL